MTKSYRRSASAPRPFTVEVAAALGWDVEYSNDGGWGHAATRRCWRIRRHSWGNVWHARCFDTADLALDEIAARLAYELGLRGTRAERIRQFDVQARVLPAAA